MRWSIHGTSFHRVNRPIDSVYYRKEVASLPVSDVDRYVIIRKFLNSIFNVLHLFIYQLDFQMYSHTGHFLTWVCLHKVWRSLVHTVNRRVQGGCDCRKWFSMCLAIGRYGLSYCREYKLHIQFKITSYICCQLFLRTLHNLTMMLLVTNSYVPRP
jgi:hypothetical protein